MKGLASLLVILLASGLAVFVLFEVGDLIEDDGTFSLLALLPVVVIAFAIGLGHLRRL